MKSSPFFLTALALILITTACKKDDVTTVILQSTEYRLQAIGPNGLTGTVTFTEDSDGKTEVLVELDDGSSVAVHPAYIRFNTLDEGGAVALTLNPCECQVSRTTVSKLDVGTSISYEGLLKLDGHVSIHESPDDYTVISAANIGTNAE
ncbi:hypothetical protein [Ulvibacterium sp.]|uniref:hypothetical protein n=1 Tax=Ulvibacterium sp. TaxID=2665914 RepID=UPI002607025A|nr:hypothetical protein [Ulvibacterium sp.]